jgi:Stress responsive A/B Barrel Domain
MRSIRLTVLLVTAAAGAGVVVSNAVRTEAAQAAEPMIGHMVYFTLADNSPAKVQALVAACDKYLSKHPGEVYYAAGPRAKEFTRDVNDQDWDVALHLVFKTKADHDKYQDAARHKQFIDENRAGWKKVRVFDSLLAAK